HRSPVRRLRVRAYGLCYRGSGGSGGIASEHSKLGREAVRQVCPLVCPLPAGTECDGLVSHSFKLVKILARRFWSYSAKSLIRRESTICNQRVGGSTPSASSKTSLVS